MILAVETRLAHADTPGSGLRRDRRSQAFVVDAVEPIHESRELLRYERWRVEWIVDSARIPEVALDPHRTEQELAEAYRPTARHHQRIEQPAPTASCPNGCLPCTERDRRSGVLTARVPCRESDAFV